MYCPRCQNKIPVKECLYLSNDSVIICKHCNAQLKPERMGVSYFFIAFLCTGIPAYLFAMKYHSLPKGLLLGLGCGIVVYGVSVIYTYATVKLVEI